MLLPFMTEVEVAPTVQPEVVDMTAAILARLHPYQNTSLQIAHTKWMENIRRQVLVLPTGTGKTVLFSTLPIWFNFKKRILVLVQRDTLAKQAKDTIEEWNPYAGKVGIEMGTLYSDGEKIVVASVQTIGTFKKLKNHDETTTWIPSKRLLKFNPDDFDAVIVDECHHSIAPSYKNIFRHFGFLDMNLKKSEEPPMRLLFGVTATPRRLDKEPLNQVYDKKVFEYPIEDAIREGWLVNPRCFRVRTNIDLESISLSDDELEKLASAVNTPERNKLIVDEWKLRAPDRKTVVFAVNVQHAVDLAKMFRKAKIKADAVWGNDPDKDKKLNKFKNGKLQVIVNCQLLIEGYDDRSIGCVVLGRPTDSESLFRQMVGRAMRLEKGVLNLLQAIAAEQAVTKRDCIVIEILDNGATEHSLAMTFSQAYGLPDEFDLQGSTLLEAKDALNRLRARVKKKDDEQKIDKVQSMFDLMELVTQQLQATVEEIDLLKVNFDPMVLSNSQLQWHRVESEHFVLLLPDGLGLIRLRRNVDGFMVLDGNELAESRRFSVTGAIKHGDFGSGFIFADRQVFRRFGQRTFDLCERNSASTGWKTLPASPPQLGRLKKLYDSRGMRMPVGITRGEASLLITQMMVRAVA
jgi:superfamily II DNA or RNA helicase